jgi:hypothetical protein
MVFRGFFPQRLETAQLTLKDSSSSVPATVAWVASLIDVEGEFDERGRGSSIAVVRKGQPYQIVHHEPHLFVVMRMRLNLV